MKIEILMSTMNKSKISELKIENKNITENLLIVNQTNNNYKYRKGNIRMYNYKERGLSKSRNRGLNNSNGDICVIADDDIKYKKNSFNIIRKAFKNNPDVDVITFQAITPQGMLFKNYYNKEFYHNKRSILKVSSIEIAFRKDSILENNISYDKNFGLGAKYNSGEENIFLMDCLRKGLKIKYIPIPIVIHPYERSGNQLNTEKIFFSKGALFTRLFGLKYIIINLVFAIKKYTEYKDEFSFFNVLKFLYKGSFDYLYNNKE